MALDNKPTRSINIKFPLEKGTAGAFAVNDETIQAVADDLKILILTNWGERVANYTFGANLRPLIFEQEGDELNQKVSDAINSAIERWMPYVNVLEIVVLDHRSDLSLGDNEVKVNLTFSVGDTDLKGDTAVILRK
jgi:phage baseplate assembly protein W